MQAVKSLALHGISFNESRDDVTPTAMTAYPR